MSVRRNTLYNVAGQFGPVPINLIVLPMFLHAIGAERYGVLSTVWIVLGYFGLFDFGLGRATAQRIAATPGTAAKDAEERSDVFWTALALNAGFGIVGALVLWPAAALIFGHFVKISGGIRAEMFAAIPWLVASLPVATISGVLTGSLQGRERFLSLNLINAVGAVLVQLAPFAVAKLVSPGLSGLVVAVLLSRLATLLLLFRECRRELPLQSPRWRGDLVRPLFGFGGWVTVSSIIGPLLSSLDKVLLGAIGGAKLVTYYAVPSSLISPAATMASGLANALFPRFSAATPEHARVLAEEAVQTMIVVVLPVVVVGTLAIQPFLTLWIDADFAAHAATAGEILALGVFANTLAMIPYGQLQGQGRPDLVAKCHLAEMLPYFAIFAVAVHQAGVVGAAVAWSLRIWADAGLLFWNAQFDWSRVRGRAPVLMVLLATGAIALGLDSGSPLRWVADLVLTGLTCALCWQIAPAGLRRLALRARLEPASTP